MAFNKKFLKDWITGQSLHADAIPFADEFGKYLCDLDGNRNSNALTTSQIRNFFGEVRRIQMKGYEENTASFLLLKPKLAYAKARVTSKNKGSFITDFYNVFNEAHSGVTNKNTFQNYIDFLEAILAYHKFHGGQ